MWGLSEQHQIGHEGGESSIEFLTPTPLTSLKEQVPDPTLGSTPLSDIRFNTEPIILPSCFTRYSTRCKPNRFVAVDK